MIKAITNKKIKILVNVLFTFVFFIILLSVIFSDGGQFSINRNHPLFTTITAAALSFIVIFFYKHFKEKEFSDNKKTVFFTISILLLTVLTILFSFKLRTNDLNGWDPSEIYQGVDSLINGKGINDVYFSRYPFQIFLIVVFYIPTKALNVLHVKIGTGLLLIMINDVFIISSIILSFFAVKKMSCWNTAFFFLILLSLFSPLLLYSPVYYTDTSSMFFIAISFLMMTFLFKAKNKISKSCCAVAISISMFFAFNIKATAIIIFIAFLFCYLFLSNNKARDKIKIALILLIPFIALNMAWSSARNEEIDQQYTFPITHWIMMGTAEYGGYNTNDYQYTLGMINNGINPQQANLKMVRSRLNGYGLIGSFLFLSKKISYTWGDGTYFASEALSRSPINSGTTFEKIFSKDGVYNSIYIQISNIIQLSIIMIIFCGAVTCIKTKTIYPLHIYVLMLSVIGVFVFLLIWEARSRYLVNIVPIIYMIECYFINQLSSLEKLY